MKDTVRIMPLQPIEAEIGDGEYKLNASAEIYWESTTDTPYAYPEGWVEVTEYVWDGTDEAFKAIANALPGAWELDACYAGWLDIWRMATGDDDGFPWVRLRPGWRVRIEGDSFAILPPKDGDA